MLKVSRVIYTTQYGSHLYGTSTPTSDVDTVSVMVPEYDDLLLQKTGKFASRHNVNDGIDTTVHSISKIVADVCSGNSTALEILFSTAGKQQNESSPLWYKIYRNRHLFLTNQSASLIGYCRSQSKKYDVRGDKMKAVSNLRLMYQRVYIFSLQVIL